jgi:hypothetical protein
MEQFHPGNGTSRIGSPNGYLPIEEHGIVGDLRTVALVCSGVTPCTMGPDRQWRRQAR